MQRDAPHLYSREAEEQFRQQALQHNQHFHHQQQHLSGGPRPVFGGEKSALVQQIQALENGYGKEKIGENYENAYFEKAGEVEQAGLEQQSQNETRGNACWTYETTHQRMPSYVHQRVQSPSPPRQLYRQGQQLLQQQRQQHPQQQYEQYIDYQEAYPPYTQQHQRNTWVEDDYDGTFPSGPPPVFTTELPQQVPPTLYYKSVADRRRAESERARRHHSPVEGASEKGYLMGGMDFINHTSPNHLSSFDPNDYEYEGEYQGHRSRRDEAVGPPRGPNDFYGLDYNTLASPQEHIQPDIHYKGYVAQQPRKHWLYTADPNAPINNFEAQVVDSVNPVKLIGDTLSNQKIDVAHELTEEEKNTFGTTYAPPAGFKPEHKTVHPEPISPGPICFSLSAKKELISGENPPQTSTPGSRSQNAIGQGRGPLSAEDSSWYITGNKEIMRNEPNWSRNVNQRRSAWETQSRSVDSRMQLPSWVKVPPQQPPYWAGRAQTTHNVWQSAADKGYLAAGNYNTGYNYSTTSTAGHPMQGQQYGKQMQAQPTQHTYVKQITTPSQPNQQDDEPNQVEFRTYIKHQYPVDQAPSGQHHQKQVYYYEEPEEHKMVDYDTEYNNHQQYGQQQQRQYLDETGKSSGQKQISHHPPQYAPQRPIQQQQQPQQQPQQQQQQPQQQQQQQQQYYQQGRQQQPEFVDRHHQQVVQLALQQAAPQHQHSTSSTTNLINQSQQPVQQLGSNQKQSSTTTNTTIYHTQQPTTTAYGGGSSAKTDYSSTNRVLPSNRSQSHYISSSSQRAGGQVAAQSNISQQHRQGGDSQQAQHSLQHHQQRQVHYQQGINAPHTPQIQGNLDIKKGPVAQRIDTGTQQQAPPQRNNYQRIIANKQINKQGVASRYPPSKQQNQQLSHNQYDVKKEMEEHLPQGQLPYSYMTTSGQFQDHDGYDVDYSRELSTTTTNSGQDMQLLKQQERRVVDEPVEDQPGVISRHVITKFYKKKTINELPINKNQFLQIKLKD